MKKARRDLSVMREFVKKQPEGWWKVRHPDRAWRVLEWVCRPARLWGERARRNNKEDET